MDKLDKTVPANPEAEEAVLGSLLIDPDAVLKVASFLEDGDFYRERNGWIYRAILDLHERREPADFVTLCDELERRKAALQTELDSIESIDQQIQSAPAAPKKGIKADPKAEQNQAAKTADQQRRKAELQRQLEQLIKDSDALIKQAQEE